jgi:preprotein translocase subunit SecE
MNTKVEQAEQAVNAADVAKYVLAVAIIAASIWAYTSALSSWAAPLRGLLVAAAVVVAGVIVSTTAKGRDARGFFSESLFELRKVVWPTRQEALKTTWVILIVVALVSIILSLFDLGISWLIRLLLGQ